MLIRLRGLVIMAGCAAGLLALIIYLSRIPIWIAAFLVVGFITGLFELISGVPMEQISAKWDAQPNEKKTLYTVLLIGGMLLIGVAFYFVYSYLYAH